MIQYMLDSGPLGRLCHPTPNATLLAIQRAILKSGLAFVVPEIADFEIRRNLILETKVQALAQLDQLKIVYRYQPITTTAMLHAAELWASARKRGRPTADSKSLDADVILAAQANEIGAVVLTDNAKHLAQFVKIIEWDKLESILP